ncbi:MAG: hypothetical protein FJ387_00930 [Verrucomicrobia bacterium]|nr:hypothetical protein [Verrucomicrobiota bacterium]
MPIPTNELTGTRVWHTAGGDNFRRGSSAVAVAAPIAGPPRHRLPAQGAVQAAVVFDETGNAFVADLAGAVQAFTAAGQLRWRVQLEGGISATPAVHPAEPWLLVGTHAGWVYALDTGTGTTRWRTAIPTTSDPRILSDLLCLPQANLVVLSSWGGKFHALDCRTGQTRTTWDAGFSPQAAAAADARGTIYCLRAVAKRGVEFVRVTSSGEATVLHTRPEGPRGARRTLVAAAPVLDETRGVAYLVMNADKDALLQAWSFASGQMIWSRSFDCAIHATPAVRRTGELVVADLAGTVHCLRPDDGSTRGRYVSGCEYLLAGAVSEQGGTAYVADPLGQLHAVDEQGAGKILFAAERSLQARPSFNPDGNLYVPASNRTVYVFVPAPHPG